MHEQFNTIEEMERHIFMQQVLNQFNYHVMHYSIKLVAYAFCVNQAAFNNPVLEQCCWRNAVIVMNITYTPFLTLKESGQ